MKGAIGAVTEVEGWSLKPNEGERREAGRSIAAELPRALALLAFTSAGFHYEATPRPR